MSKRQRSTGKPLPAREHIHGAAKWIMVALTTVGVIIGILVNARSLGLPWLGLDSVNLANLAARRVLLAPYHDTLSAVGDTLQLAATVIDAHGATVVGATVVWATDDSAVATVDSSGAVVARGPGTATISASVREHAGRASVTVAQRVRSVVIAGDTIIRLPEGGAVQLLARARDSRGRLVAGRTVRWESADSTVVAVSPSGSASARTPGRTTLTASVGGVSASMPAEVTLAPASARLRSGGDQRASAGRRLPQSVTVQVLSHGGRPVPGAAVSFATAEAQGKVDPAETTTDGGGRTSVSWSLAPQAGRQHLLVTIAGLDTSVVVTAEADPVPANTRVQLVGDASSLQGPVGTPLASPVGIRVTDSSGVAAADVPVAWTTANGGTVEALAPRTDSLGQAWARWTLDRRAGAQRVRILVGNPRTMPPFVVTATALPGSAVAVAIESGADQGGAVGAALRHPIVARLTDREGNLAAGATLRVHAGSGSVPETLLVADRRGRASLRWTLGRRAGPQWLELRAGEGAAVLVSARAHPLEPANILPNEAPRSAAAGRALPRPLVFVVTDAYGNAIPDVQVVFAATSGSVEPVRVMTDAKGQAATRWTLGSEAGEQTLTARVRGSAVKDSVVVRAVKRTAGR
jgi:hypothetical protein